MKSLFFIFLVVQSFYVAVSLAADEINSVKALASSFSCARRDFLRLKEIQLPAQLDSREAFEAIIALNESLTQKCPTKIRRECASTDSDVAHAISETRGFGLHKKVIGPIHSLGMSATYMGTNPLYSKSTPLEDEYRVEINSSEFENGVDCFTKALLPASEQKIKEILKARVCRLSVTNSGAFLGNEKIMEVQSPHIESDGMTMELNEDNVEFSDSNINGIVGLIFASYSHKVFDDRRSALDPKSERTVRRIMRFSSYKNDLQKFKDLNEKVYSYEYSQMAPSGQIIRIYLKEGVNDVAIRIDTTKQFHRLFRNDREPLFDDRSVIANALSFDELSATLSLYDGGFVSFDCKQRR